MSPLLNFCIYMNQIHRHEDNFIPHNIVGSLHAIKDFGSSCDNHSMAMNFFNDLSVCRTGP